jgi:adenylosuccinate lyase
MGLVPEPISTQVIPRDRHGEGDFQSLLKKDPDVKKHLTDAEIEEQFDLGYQFKHVDTIFKRVSGE